ncbi:hypothetical protein [Chitinophaga polysaccharea]|uniref:hypothetical protein n=1 Tax=Chitinophaga polysaccharea TaxID=1293035 RepID=UPI00115B1AFE|nr:hypothetical protein [Chitinophaga polysaccharea]
MLKIVMRPLKSAMPVLLLLVLAISGCQKNSSELAQNRPTDISVKEAKNWLSLGPSGIQPVLKQRPNPGIPDWGNAQFFKFQDKSSILKVPLIGYNLPVGYRDILFQKDSNGIVLGAIQEVRPVKAYLTAKGREGDENMRQFVTNGDFTGDIIIFDPFDNVPLRGRRFKDGLVTGDLKYKSRALMVDDPIDPPKPKKKPGGLDDDGPGFEIDLPPVEVTAPGPRTPSTPGTNIPFPSEPVLPKPGGPVTPNNPMPIGGGGSGTHTSVFDIANKLTTPCFKTIFSEIQSKTLQNTISKMLNKLFGSTDVINLDIEEGKLKQGVDGDTRDMGTSRGYRAIGITLNTSELQNASKEYIAATILHEAVHGINSIIEANKKYKTGTLGTKCN